MNNVRFPEPAGLQHIQKSTHLIAYHDVKRLLARHAPESAGRCEAHTWKQIGQLPYFACSSCGAYREFARFKQRAYWIYFSEAGRVRGRLFIRHENKPNLFLSYLAVRAFQIRGVEVCGYLPSRRARELIKTRRTDRLRADDPCCGGYADA